jgi:hypothetical protein
MFALLLLAEASFVSDTLLPALLRIALDPTFISVALAIVVILVKRASAVRGAQIEAAVSAAFHIVEDLKKTGVLPAGAAKPVLALEKLQEITSNQKITLTDAEIELAKAAWSAMHGAQTGVAAADNAAPAKAPETDKGAPEISAVPS